MALLTDILPALRYPIGEFVLPGVLTPGDRARAIESIETVPATLLHAVEGLSTEQLNTPYRRDGWTVRQVVHHLPDSHLNSYIRLKLALTEDVPLIRTYDEAEWAMLPDAAGPVNLSLVLLESLHVRWVYLWRHLDKGHWSRLLRHPELGEMTIDDLLAFYAWHGQHHLAQITELVAREGW